MHLTKVVLHPERYPTDEAYPFGLAVLRQTREIAFLSPVTFFIGENGSGKSTLLRAICHACGIHIWQEAERISLEINPYADQLHRYIEVKWRDGTVPGSFFASQIFQDFARFLDEWARASPGILEYFGGKSLISQSHGESFLAYFTSIYRRKGIYFMDEPETALSPQSQLRLVRLLRDFGEAGHAQFIIATHSPILLACPGAVIYSFDQAPVSRLSYEDTDLYRLYRDFMNRRCNYL